MEIYFKDIEGRYVKISRQFEKIFNVSDESVRGKLPQDIHEQELARRTREHDLNVLKSRKAVIREEQAELPGINDGLEHTLLTVKFPLFDDNQELFGLGAIVTDITGQKNVQKQLRLHNERFQDFVESAADYYWEVDDEDQFTFVSGNTAFTGYPSEELIHQSQRQVFDAGVEMDNTWKMHLQLKAEHKPYSLEFSFTNQAGKHFRIFSKAKPLFDGQHNFTGYRGVGRDISNEYRLQQNIRYQADHDPLTGLYNRRKFLSLVEEIINSQPEDSSTSFIGYLDLDRFKFINDSVDMQRAILFLNSLPI